MNDIWIGFMVVPTWRTMAMKLANSRPDSTTHRMPRTFGGKSAHWLLIASIRLRRLRLGR